MNSSARDSFPLVPGSVEFANLPPCVHYCGNERFALKAIEIQDKLTAEYGWCPVDIVLDLEDGAPAGGEAELREAFCRLLNSNHNKQKRLGLRVHDFQHPQFAADVKIVLESAGKVLPFIVLPKPQGVKEVQRAYDEILAASKKAGISPPKLHVLIETLSAVREVWEIAKLPFVETLEFGNMDYVSEHAGIIPEENMRSPGQFDHVLMRRAKTEIVAAACAYGKVAVHNVTVNVRDVNQCISDATRARKEFGFTRMWSIHPSQIEPIIKVMIPDQKEVEFSSKVIDAARKASWGPVEIEQRLYDRASFRYHWEILKRAGKV